jgi:hypothetical protein
MYNTAMQGYQQTSMRLQDWHNGYSQYLLNVTGTHGKINLKFRQGN